MTTFTHQSFDQRVLFDVDHLAVLPGVAGDLGLRRVVVLTTPGHAKPGAVLAAALGASTFAGAKMHTPVAVTEAALAILGDADGVVSLGGGSAIGLGKALALRGGVKHIAVSTTYAGSEMTPVLGQTFDGRKTTIRDKRVVPQAVVYDVGLTMGLPDDISATSGLNAIAHAVEALYAPDRDPVTDLLALEAIGAFAEALPMIHVNGEDRAARTRALYGAFLAGRTLASATMGLHHKLAHVLGGLFDLPHAPMHAALLPHVVAFNEAAAGHLLVPVAQRLGADSAAQGLARLARAIGAPTTLAALGMPRDGIEQAVVEVMKAPPANPRALKIEDLRELLARAYGAEGL